MNQNSTCKDVLCLISTMSPRHIHCLINHHAMKMYWVSGGIAPCIFKLYNRWWSASCPDHFNSRERTSGTHWIGGPGHRNLSNTGFYNEYLRAWIWKVKVWCALKSTEVLGSSFFMKKNKQKCVLEYATKLSFSTAWRKC